MSTSEKVEAKGVPFGPIDLNKDIQRFTLRMGFYQRPFHLSCTDSGFVFIVVPHASRTIPLTTRLFTVVKESVLEEPVAEGTVEKLKGVLCGEEVAEFTHRGIAFKVYFS